MNAFTRSHGGFYEKCMLENVDPEPLIPEKPKSPKITPRVKQSAALKKKEEIKINVEEFEIEERRNAMMNNQDHTDNSLNNYNSKMSGIFNKGSPTFLSKDDDIQKMMISNIHSSRFKNRGYAVGGFGPIGLGEES